MCCLRSSAFLRRSARDIFSHLQLAPHLAPQSSSESTVSSSSSSEELVVADAADVLGAEVVGVAPGAITFLDLRLSFFL